MHRLDLVGTLTGVRFGTATAQVEIVQAESGDAPRGQVINHVWRETVMLPGAVGAQTGLPVHGGDRVALTVERGGGSVMTDAVDAAPRLDGAASVTTFLSGSGPLHGQMVEMRAVDAGKSTWFCSACPAGTGLAIHQINADRTLTARGTVVDPAATAAVTIASMVSAQVGTVQILQAGSPTAHGVQTWSIGANGGLTALGLQGPAQAVPMQGVTARGGAGRSDLYHRGGGRIVKPDGVSGGRRRAAECGRSSDRRSGQAICQCHRAGRHRG